MENCSRRRRKKAMALTTTIRSFLADTLLKVFALTMRTLQTLGPTDANEIIFARFLGAELKELHHCHATIFVGHEAILSVFVP